MTFLDEKLNSQSRKNRLNETISNDVHIRFNFSLSESFRLDDANKLLFLRQSVFLQSKSLKNLTIATLRILVSNFYFVLDNVSCYSNDIHHCQRSVRCRLSFQLVIKTLAKRETLSIEYVTFFNVLSFSQDICSICHRYRAKIHFDVCQKFDMITVSLRMLNDMSFKLSEFSQIIEEFIDAQELNFSFNTINHDNQNILFCDKCLISKRKALLSALIQRKKCRL